MKKNICPVCGEDNSEIVFSSVDVPTYQNVAFSVYEESIKVPRGNLNLRFCPECTFLWNESFDFNLIGYNKNYENDQTHSDYFIAHINEIISAISENQKNNRNNRYLEVGCGNGVFLQQLKKHIVDGYFVGFDASLNIDFTFSGGKIYNRYYTEKDLGGFGAIISRHVIEHIPNPVPFLRMILKKNPKATIFTETPRLEWILDNLAFFDFFYEHCSYFSELSIETLFNKLKLDVINNISVFRDQYMLVISANSKEKKNSHLRKIFLDEIKYFFSKFNLMKKNITNCIKFHFKLGRQIYIWGAGAKGVTLCNIIDAKREKIKCLIDINPKKQGKYISGSGHKIESPDVLNKDIEKKIVFVMNKNYFLEILNKHKKENTNFFCVEDFIKDRVEKANAIR